jgi:hypothetical protein
MPREENTRELVLKHYLGAFVFALMQKLFKEVKFIRKKGKLAPPVFTTEYRGSHVAVISSERTGESHALCIKVGDILPGNFVFCFFVNSFVVNHLYRPASSYTGRRSSDRRHDISVCGFGTSSRSEVDESYLYC